MVAVPTAALEQADEYVEEVEKGKSGRSKLTLESGNLKSTTG
jgi:hypothetical protein